MYGGKEFEVPGDLVEAFGAAVAEAVAWKDEQAVKGEPDA